MNLSNKLSGIELKVRELAFKLERLKRENAVLRDENEELRMEIETLQGRPGGTPHSSARALDNEESDQNIASDQLKEKIDQYIKEIDKCIEWLHNY
jgi:regulator of replication initiation timing